MLFLNFLAGKNQTISLDLSFLFLLSVNAQKAIAVSLNIFKMNIQVCLSKIKCLLCFWGCFGLSLAPSRRCGGVRQYETR